MPKNILSVIICFTVLPIAINSAQRFAYAPIGSTLVWWIIKAIILIIFLISRLTFFESENKRHFIFIKLFLIWVIFSIIRGVFMAEMYWDYKSLVSRSFELLLPIIAYAASNKKILQSMLSFFIKYTIPIALAIVTFQGLFTAKSWILSPISLLILFLPAFKIQWKVITLIIALSIFIDGIILGARSDLFKYGVPILMLSLYYFRFFVESDEIIKVARKILMIAPWVFFWLAVSGIFNVFKIKEYFQINYVAKSTTTDGVTHQQDITQDSRTFIYREVLQSAKKHNYWILGRSPSRGNDTAAFADYFMEITGKSERYRNEANVPNIFTWMGVIGLALYFLIFYKASYLAIYHSNNIYIKLIGLFVAFRWMFAWVEDASTFGMNDLTIWFMIGICLSESFRRMNNLEVKLWARGIFDKKYVRFLDYIKRDIYKTTTLKII